jgi:hypothetical protein
MLTSILHPVVHRTRRRSSRLVWLELATLHSIGCVASAALLGGGLAFTASLLRGFELEPSRWAWWTALAIALVYGPRQLGWTRRPPLLQSTRQVPRRWAFVYPRRVTALLFGLGLGNGLYTRIVVPTFYFVVLWPFLMRGYSWPLMIWTAYGAARSLHVWWIACTAPGDDPSFHAHLVAYQLTGRATWMKYANASALIAVLVWLLWFSERA